MIKTIIYGCGEIGVRIAKLILKKRNIKIVGSVDIDKEKIGRDLGELIKGEKIGAEIFSTLSNALAETDAQVVLHATSSYLKDTYSQLKEAVEAELNIISTCEELSYPYLKLPEIALDSDQRCKQHGVTVLGTGINPGFLMDTLPIALTGICQDVKKIKVKRIMNAATRRLPFQKKIGAGLSLADFKKKLAGKQITGHVGLSESISLIADALGWKLDGLELGEVEPILAKEVYESDLIRIKPGSVAGLRQVACGVKKDERVITLDFQAFIGAKKEYDSIYIEGNPTINEKISPCVHGDIGTVAMVVNSIPLVINAQPGLITMKDLPIPRIYE
jgi:4-hydroxy-tetrahydrodipicolinate reductase